MKEYWTEVGLIAVLTVVCLGFIALLFFAGYSVGKTTGDCSARNGELEGSHCVKDDRVVKKY